MARYHASVDTQQAPAEVFNHLSNFSTAAEWDPGVVEAERLSDAPLGEGALFRLVARFMGRRTSLTYRIVEYDQPRAVTFLGENATVTSLDRMVFESAGAGTRLTYDADLRLKGPLRILDPLLQVAFRRTGDRALAGLQRVLSAP